MAILLFLIFFIFLLVLYYDVYNIMRLSIIENLKVNKFIKIIISLLILAIPLLFYSVYNYIIILIHLEVFILLSNLILYIIEKIRKKKIKKNNLKVILGVIITIIYLGIGTYLNYHIFETKYTVYTEKDVNLRIIMFSDSHIGTTFNGDGFYKEMEKLSKTDSDFVFIVGDYIDDDTSEEDLRKACEGLSLLKPKYGVYYVYGNHDRGYNSERSKILRYELEKNNVHILVDEVVEFNNFYLIGRNDKRYPRHSIDELIEGLDDRYKIVLNHQPNDYDNEQGKVDLVLSGHTHGGQMIPLGLIGTISGSNDMEYGLKEINNTNFIVTSGISCWAVQFKTGTKSEYVIIDIKNK